MKTITIGLDIGRGFVKVVSENKQFKFPSVYMNGRNLGMSGDNQRIDLTIEGMGHYFVGDYATTSPNVIEYASESKTCEVAEVLFWSALSQLQNEEKHLKVNVMLGVPKDSYNKRVLNEIKEKYEGQSQLITNNVTGFEQAIQVDQISIYAEARAASLHVLTTVPNLDNIPWAVVTVGMRTTETAYFNQGNKYDNELSESLEIGNRTFLRQAKGNISAKLSDAELDRSMIPTHIEAKRAAYSSAATQLKQKLEIAWSTKLGYTRIFVAGGTSENLELPYELVSNPQMAVAQGLYRAAKRKFE